MPSPANRPFARVVVAEDGTPLTAFADRQGIWRYPITLNEVSPAYLQALLTYEDRWFWYHPGVNPLALLRALGQYVRTGRVLSGGSTLSMQVARILEPMPQRTLINKARQMLRALQLEMHYSKRELLSLYLNLAPFGGTLEGVQAASYTYFGKPARQLSDAEAALLAVLPQAPTRYRPDRNPQNARAARDKLLQRLQHLQVWPAERVQDAQLESVSAQRFTTPSIAPLLSRRLVQAAPQQSLIRSSIDITLQQGLEDLTRQYAQRLPIGTSAALLVVDNRNQQVKAYIGSADFYANNRFGQIDMVQAIRSPGSTLKPFLYGMALDEGLVHSESLLIDAPIAFGQYRPQNFSSGFSGPVSLADALRRSLNLPAVQLLQAIGPNELVSRLKNAGAQMHLAKGASPNLSVILGGLGSNLESLTRLYTAFNQKGQVAPLLLTPTNTPPAESRYVMSPGAAWIIKTLLQGDHNTPSPPTTPPNPNSLAWKTGTSYGFRDAWALGVQGHYTLGVWVGRPDGTPLLGASGTTTAAPLLFSAAAHVKTVLPRAATSAPPTSVSSTDICWPLGRERATTAEALCHQRRSAYILNGVIPPTLPDPQDTQWSTLHTLFLTDAANGLRVDNRCPTGPSRPQEVALWPQSLEPWLSPQQQRRQAIPRYHPNCPQPPALTLGPASINTLYTGIHIRAPAGSHSLPSVTLKSTNTQGQCYWYINGRLSYTQDCATPIAHTFEHLGAFQIMVTDEQGQNALVRGWVDAGEG